MPRGGIDGRISRELVASIPFFSWRAVRAAITRPCAVAKSRPFSVRRLQIAPITISEFLPGTLTNTFLLERARRRRTSAITEMVGRCGRCHISPPDLPATGASATSSCMESGHRSKTRIRIGAPVVTREDEGKEQRKRQVGVGKERKNCDPSACAHAHTPNYHSAFCFHAANGTRAKGASGVPRERDSIVLCPPSACRAAPRVPAMVKNGAQLIGRAHARAAPRR